MKIILSPAKKMIVDTDNLAPVELPVYIDKTAEVLNWMKSKSKEELKAIWKCNDKIAEQNFNRLENMDLYNRLTPAVLAYEGIAFQYMAPSVFEIQQFEYLQNHLRILSAFYGILKPMDGVTPYRLEMQAKVGIGDAKNLYEYWGELLYRSVIDDSRIIINLASKEYSKCIEKYLTPQDRYITIVFCELSGDKLVTKGTYAKMARGEMVRFIAENNIENPVEIQKFDRIGYSFRSDLSSNSKYVFLNFIAYREIEEWGYDKYFNNNKVISPIYKSMKIKDLCNIGSGGTPSRSHQHYYNGNIPWIKTGEVIDDIILNTEEHISQEAINNSSAKIYPQGSLIIAMYGQGNTRGRTAKLGIDATTNQACAVLFNINNDIVITDYLWYYLQTQYHNLRSMASGNNQPNLNADKIKNYSVVIPPLSVQKEIVEHINEQKGQIRYCKLQAEHLHTQGLANFGKKIFE